MNTYELRIRGLDRESLGSARSRLSACPDVCDLVRAGGKDWAESTITVGWFAFVFSLWARAWIRTRLDEVAVRIQAEERRRQ